MMPEYYGFDELMPFENIARIVMTVYIVVASLALLFAILVYVFQSVGLHSLAKRRGIHHSWLAWIPIGNMWLLGSISDQYQYVAKGRIRNRRNVLLGLMIAVYVLLFAVVGVFAALSVGSMIKDGLSATWTMVAPMTGMLGVYFVAWVLSIVALVFMYIAYYDLFASCSPDNAVVFLLLSIFFKTLIPFFVFALRKRDGGMPPRRVVVQTAPWTPAEHAAPAVEAAAEEAAVEEIAEEAEVEETTEEATEEETAEEVTEEDFQDA